MTNYELCVLFSGAITPAEIETQSQQVEALLKTAEAKIELAHNLGRKKLAYAIKGNTYGEYRLWLFSAEAKTIPVLNDKLRLSSFVVRHIVTTLESDGLAKRLQSIQSGKTIKPKENMETIEPVIAEAPAVVPEPIIAPIVPIVPETEPEEPAARPGKEKEKLSFEDLDKKLDEILGSDKI